MGVLGRQDDGRRLDRLAVFVAQRDLAFRIGAQRRLGTGFAGLGQTAQDRMGILDRRRHQLCRLGRGIAEHDPLIARTFVLAGAGVHALRDMRRLLVQQVGDLASGMVELVLLVADVLDAGARDILDLVHVVGQSPLIGQADLAADHDAVGGGECFAGDTGLGFLAQEGVKDGVRNPVADLVGVALGNGFRSEDVVLPCHG